MPGKDSITDDSLLDDDLGDDHVDDQGLDAGEGDGKKAEGEPRGDKTTGDDIEVVLGDDALDPESDPEKAAGALDRDRDGERQQEDEDAAYSTKVRDRIERERRSAREANARAEAAHAARLVAERSAIGRQREAVATTKAALEMQIEGIKVALVKAKEDGKSAEEVELQSKLNTAQTRLESLAGAENQLNAEEEALKRGATVGPNPLAEAWKRANAWFGNPRFGEQTAIVRVIDAALANAGYDKNSAEYYEELNRRIRRRLPEMQKFMGRQRPAQDRGDGRPAQRREPVAGVRRADPSRPQGAAPRKVVLTREDLANMANFGLDSKNPEHMKEYARNKSSNAKG